MIHAPLFPVLRGVVGIEVVVVDIDDVGDGENADLARTQIRAWNMINDQTIRLKQRHKSLIRKMLAESWKF